MPIFSKIPDAIRRFGTAKTSPHAEFIASIHTDQTGGMTMVDVVTLRDGKVLTVTDECAVLWSCLDHWESAWEDGENNMLDHMDLTHLPTEASDHPRDTGHPDPQDYEGATRHV